MLTRGVYSTKVVTNNPIETKIETRFVMLFKIKFSLYVYYSLLVGPALRTAFVALTLLFHTVPFLVLNNLCLIFVVATPDTFHLFTASGWTTAAVTLFVLGNVGYFLKPAVRRIEAIVAALGLSWIVLALVLIISDQFAAGTSATEASYSYAGYSLVGRVFQAVLLALIASLSWWSYGEKVRRLAQARLRSVVGWVGRSDWYAYAFVLVWCFKLYRKKNAW